MFYRKAVQQLLGTYAPATLLLVLTFASHAQNVAAPETFSRHPLEIRALTDPNGVRQELPELIKRATGANDFREVALLSLAESNACRVVADWPCQSSAAARALVAAQTANIPELQARGLILESRGRMAMQDLAAPRSY